MLQRPHMGTTSSQIDSLRIIRALIACKGLHEFDRTLSQELLKALKGDLVGFYLFSEKAKTFAPVSDLLGILSPQAISSDNCLQQGR